MPPKSNTPQIELRPYTTDDLADVLSLFCETVHTICAKDYTKEQLQAWTEGSRDQDHFNATLLAHHAVVAIADGVLAGFGDVDKDYLDRLYVHKDYQGIGIATQMTSALERHAKESGQSTLTVHASITARPFFSNRGYRQLKEQQVERKTQLLTNYIMEKPL